MVTTTPEEFVTRLREAFVCEGKPFGRLRFIEEEQGAHWNKITTGLKGYAAAADAFKCFFLETVEALNIEIRTKVITQMSEFYPQFMQRLVHSFQTLCAAQVSGHAGYTLQAYTSLRNVFDNLILTSAAMQKITDFYSIEGIDPTKPLNMKDPVAVMKEVRRRRKATEQAVQKQMSGSASGLSADTLEAFRTWNELFDIETHGARLTIGLGMDYMKGKKPLRVAPQYNAMSVAIFVNRYCEIAWMVHRLLPLVQPPEAMLSAGWGERWRLVDES